MVVSSVKENGVIEITVWATYVDS